MASITGVIYKDVNGNGDRDTSDPLMPGYSLSVYTRPSTGSSYSLFRTITTNSNGVYSVTDLPSGVQAMISPNHPSGFAYADASSLGWTTTYDTTFDFGVTDHSVYRGYVFVDANANGIRDTGDPISVAGTRAYFDLNNDNAFTAGEPTALTDAGGMWYIGNINPGTYTVRIIPPAGYTQTAPAARSVTMSFGPQPINTYTYDFGITTAVQTSTITGYSFTDLNGDGVRQSTEPRNAGRTIYVDSNVNGKVDTDETSVVTDSTGLFTLKPKNLTGSSTFFVREVIPTGYYATTQKSALYSVRLAPGESVFAGDVFGSNTQQFLVSGRVFSDLDGHGVYDNGSDAPLAGRTVYADLNYDGRLSTGEPSTITDNLGRYSISFTKPGNYQIGQVLPAGYKASRPPNTSTASPYAYLNETSPTATIDFGSRLITNSISIDAAAGVWNAPAQADDAGSGRVIPLADGGWLVDTAVFSATSAYLRDTIRRFRSDGTLDTTFGANGLLTLYPGEGSDVFELPDGNLLVAGATFGSQYGILRRFTASGKLDTAFGNNGVVNDYTGLSQSTVVGQIALATDGDILISASTGITGNPTFSHRPVVTRLSPSGTRRVSFGTDGNYIDMTSQVYITDVKMAPTTDNGVVLVAGQNQLVKINFNGQIDTGFGTNGIFLVNSGSFPVSLSGLKTLPDGRLLLRGQVNNRAFIGISFAFGRLDSFFGTAGLALLPTPVLHPGVVTVDTFADVLPLPDGGYLAVGKGQGSTEVSDLLLVRFNADGEINTKAFTNGRGTFALSASNDAGTSITFSPDGRILIGATSLESHQASVVHLVLPTVGLANNLTVAEGATLPLLARGIINGGTIQWDFDYDGVHFDQDAVGSSTEFKPGDTDGPTVRVIGLRGVDANGFEATISKLVTITNAAPTASLSGSTVSLGTASTVTFTNAADASAADTAAGFVYSFDFNNDGDFVDPGEIADAATPSAGFVFPVAGTFTVHGRITDKDGGYTDYTTPVTVQAPPTQSVTLEAETATLSGGTTKGSGNVGYTGIGYADFGGQNSAAQWSITRSSPGTTTLSFRYANGATSNRPLTVYVNNVNVGTLPFAPTGGWTKWASVSINANLLAGANTIKIVATTTAGGANVDSLTVSGSVTPPPPATASINGFVFDDANKNGLYDTGDTLPTGRRVFLDADNDGAFDSNEISQLTAANGVFAFANLPAGTYRVREVLPANTSYSTAAADVVLATGQAVSNVAIGVKANPVTPPPTGNAGISGIVYNDNNKNGKFDTGDGYAKGVVVFLDADNDGKLDAGEANALTDNSGKYSFANLATGTYRVRRTFPVAGYTYSTPLLNPTLTAGQVKTGQSIGTKKV